ncbi:glycosyltransferase [Vibrio splendidus]
MNIGFVTVWGNRGASVVTESIISAISGNNKTYVYSRGGEASIRHQSSENVYIGKESSLPITTYIDKHDFLSWIKGNNIELVIFNEQHWFEPVIWLKDEGIKCVTYIDYYTEETIPLFGLFDGLICNTKRHFDVFKEYKAVYVPWGVDLNKYNEKQRKPSKNVVRFFHSCGMNPHRKGTDLLLLAASKIDSNFKLIIHTQRNLEEFYKNDSSILECISSLKLQAKLEVIEKTVPAPGLYHLGDVYVYPCRLDGLGLTVPEAIASCLPTIVPDYAPMTDFTSLACKTVGIERVFSRKDGYYWPQHEVKIDCLVAAMNSFLLSSKLIDKQRAARAHAVNHLDWKKNSSILNEFIQDVVYTPVDDTSLNYYSNYKKLGYRKIETLIYSYKSIFECVFSINKKMKIK